MKRRVWVCIGLTICTGLLAGKARAQLPSLPGAGGSSISPLANAKTVPDATPFKPTIDQFVQGQMQALVDPATQKDAREKLIQECTPGSTTSFFDVYAKAINAAAIKLLSTNPSLRVRVNIAVLLNEVGRITKSVDKSTDLEGSVLMLVNDPAEPVVLRGLQAAHPVIAAILIGPTKGTGDKLIAAILPAMKAHPKSGLIASEAYHALLPDDSVPPATRQIIDPLVLGSILDLVDFRISLYTNTIPDNPVAENEIPTFVYHSYQYATPAMQRRAVQTLVNLITVVGPQAQNASKSDVSAMVQTLIYSAGALSKNVPAVATTLQPIATLSKSTAGPAVGPKVATLFTQLQSLVPYLKAPPTVVPATTQPAP